MKIVTLGQLRRPFDRFHTQKRLKAPTPIRRVQDDTMSDDSHEAAAASTLQFLHRFPKSTQGLRAMQLMEEQVHACDAGRVNDVQLLNPDTAPPLPQIQQLLRDERVEASGRAMTQWKTVTFSLI